MIINVNGTSANGTNVSVDGVSATNVWVQFYSTAVPSTEAIATVNVVTASSSADQGVMNGAGIHVQIQSGTNSFHGSAYWYNENNALKATPYFQPTGTKKPKYVDNDAGGTLGGPIIKDKLFFFGSYEGDFLREAMGNFYTLHARYGQRESGLIDSDLRSHYWKCRWQRQDAVSKRFHRELHHSLRSNQFNFKDAHRADPERCS